jgi:SAM-dependent methyltransferase
VERKRAWEAVAIAEAYERGRPEYPAEAIRWLAGPPSGRVLELGAGTGKLTRGLVALGHDVTAVEPAGEMRALLDAEVPAATVLAGSAEALPLGDGSVDTVVAAQAFHWFEHDLALREIARVLRPGGRLGLVWNMRDDSVPWVARLESVLGPERLEHGWPVDVLAASALFGDVEQASFRHEQRVDRSRLRDLVLSRSAVATAEPALRDQILAGVESIYDDEAARTGADSLVVPYVTYCFRAAKPS